MSGLSTEELIAELAGRAEPVRRIPRIRSVVAGMLLTCTAASFVLLTAGGGVGAAFATAPWRAPSFALVLVGLALLSGAALSALASAVPGRETLARGGAVAAVAGVGFALVGGIAAALNPSPAPAADLASSAACISKAAAIASLPLVIAAVFLARGLVRRRRLTAGLGVLGASALAGIAIHLSCRVEGTLHVLLGHAMAPLVLSLVLAVPVGWLITRRGERPEPGSGGDGPESP